MGDKYYYILLTFNFLIYFFCIYFILKRKDFTCLSIRSPFLLLLNNISGFMISLFIILDKIFENNKDFEKFLGIFAYFFQILMILSFLMRSHRIYKCCNIKTDERIDIQLFYNQRYIFQENYYVRKLMFIFIICFVIFYIFCYFLLDEFFTNINILFGEFDKNKEIVIIWNIINFLEIFALIFYSCLLTINKVKQKILLEIYLVTIAWFIFYNVITACAIYDKEIINKYKIIIISIFLYFCLFLNGFFPIILSFCYHTSIPYHFNPKLMNNFYLFLSNEDCYHEFNNYLIEKKNKNEENLLKIYSYIMKFKLMYFSEEIIEIVKDEAKKIYRLFFENININNNINNNNIDNSSENFIDTGNNLISNNNNIIFDNKIIDSIKTKYNKVFLNNNNIISNEENNNNDIQDIFDDALKYCYEKLGEKFIEFRKTNSFQNLYEELAYNSYIQCKMSNTGLLNKF